MEASCLTEEKCYRHPGISAIRHRQIASTFNFRSISKEDVLDALRGINPHRTTGFDRLPPRMLKLVTYEIAEPICTKKEPPTRFQTGSLFPLKIKSS